MHQIGILGGSSHRDGGAHERPFPAQKRRNFLRNFGGDYLECATAPGKNECGKGLHFGGCSAATRASSAGTPQKSALLYSWGLCAARGPHVGRCITTHTGEPRWCLARRAPINVRRGSGSGSKRLTDLRKNALPMCPSCGKPLPRKCRSSARARGRCEGSAEKRLRR